MASSSGDQYSIRIGGDANGPVVAGRGNRVEVRADDDQSPESTQTNSASGHATMYTVMHGEQHIHHEGHQEPEESEQPDPDGAGDG